MRTIEDWIDRNAVYLTIGVIALAAALRIYHINYQSLWLDELYSIIPADPQKPLSSIVENSKHDQPPLFFIYLHYIFSLFGYNEYVGRMASAFVGMLGIVSVYFLGKECSGKSVGQLAAFLTSISFFHVYYSQELRFYTMTFLLSTLSYLFFIRAYKRIKIIDFMAYAVSAVLLMYTHFFGIIIFAVQSLTFLVLLAYRRDVRFIVYSLISGTLILLAFTPWIPVIFEWSGITKFWIERPSPFFIAVYFYDYTGKEIVTTVVYLLFIFLFVKWFRSRRLISDQQKQIELIIIIWIAFSYLIPYLRSMMSAPMIQPRYTMVTLPAWFVLLALGWDRVKGAWRYALPLILVVSFAINMLFFRQHYSRLEKDQFREASELVKSVNTNHIPVLSALPWHFNYYFRNDPEKVGDVNAVDLSSVNEFWLLQAHASEEDMTREIGNLELTFSQVEKHAFFGANAVLMKKK